jgi:hypothetical protein
VNGNLDTHHHNSSSALKVPKSDSKCVANTPEKALKSIENAAKTALNGLKFRSKRSHITRWKSQSGDTKTALKAAIARDLI